MTFEIRSYGPESDRHAVSERSQMTIWPSALWANRRSATATHKDTYVEASFFSSIIGTFGIEMEWKRHDV